MGYYFLSKNDPHRFAQTSLYQFKSKLAMAQTNIDRSTQNLLPNVHQSSIQYIFIDIYRKNNLKHLQFLMSINSSQRVEIFHCKQKMIK